jgi:hypothetical protein
LSAGLFLRLELSSIGQFLERFNAQAGCAMVKRISAAIQRSSKLFVFGRFVP